MLKNSWIFPIVQVLHLAGIVALAGSIVLRDLRTLGLSQAGVSGKWRLSGLAVLAITGPVLFLSDVPRYLSNPAFLVKMAVLALAVTFHFTLHRRESRLAAIISILLWTCVLLAGRAIADFDVYV